MKRWHPATHKEVIVCRRRDNKRGEGTLLTQTPSPPPEIGRWPKGSPKPRSKGGAQTIHSRLYEEVSRVGVYGVFLNYSPELVRLRRRHKNNADEQRQRRALLEARCVQQST